MTITDILAPENALVDLRASGKAQVLAALARRAAAATGIPAESVVAALTRREDLGSTGMGGGIAIPHARFPEIGTPFGTLARLRTAIPFDAVDDRRVDLVVLLLLPVGTGGANLNALACVSRRLRDRALVDTLRHAGTAAELYAAFVSASPSEAARQL